MHIGTAAWSIPRESADSFPDAGTHLERYARVLDCVEINSSFYRPHRPETYAKWAAQTPPRFRFSVKLPRTITHDARLRAAREPLARLLGETAGLGGKLGVLLMQLPPSLAFDARVARAFLRLLRASWDGPVACEPRHASWFEEKAERTLVDFRVARVAADPAPADAAAVPGGWLGPDGDGAGALLYERWHGSPRIYWSRYEDAWLRERAHRLKDRPTTADCWVIFDNTASGAATANALELKGLANERGRAAARRIKAP